MITKSLGKVGIANKGEFAMDKTYNQCDFVHHKGSTWLALKNDLIGIEPIEGENWKYLARGFEAELLNMITATDTLGLLGEAGQKANAQNLIDVIADKVATKLIEKGMIANNLATDNAEMVLSAPMGKYLQEQITEQNNNLSALYRVTGSIKNFALSCNKGLTTFSTTPETTDLPTQTIEWQYCSGYVLRRDDPTSNLTIVLYSRLTNKTASMSTDIAGSERKWSGWEFFVKNSDFKSVYCAVETIANKAVPIPNSPNAINYIPVVCGSLYTLEHNTTVQYDGGKWYVYSTHSQRISVFFYKAI